MLLIKLFFVYETNSANIAWNFIGAAEGGDGFKIDLQKEGLHRVVLKYDECNWEKTRIKQSRVNGIFWQTKNLGFNDGRYGLMWP